jgi:3-hydroxy-9,10-secoandrosta-1,3,5(10)-triene-9,17-dione monooxygenase reductase component
MSDPAQALTPQRLRQAFGTFATGIAVIGARADDGPLVGMTVNSFGSVSLAPPLVMFCPARSARAFAVYNTTRFFSASVLRRDSRAVSERFAQAGTGKWQGVQHRIGDSGVPLLEGALATFECAVEARHDAGDHVIVLGRVLNVELPEPAEPLVFFRSHYRELTPLGATDYATFLEWGL